MGVIILVLIIWLAIVSSKLSKARTGLTMMQQRMYDVEAWVGMRNPDMPSAAIPDSEGVNPEEVTEIARPSQSGRPSVRKGTAGFSRKSKPTQHPDNQRLDDNPAQQQGAVPQGRSGVKSRTQAQAAANARANDRTYQNIANQQPKNPQMNSSEKPAVKTKANLAGQGGISGNPVKAATPSVTPSVMRTNSRIQPASPLAAKAMQEKQQAKATAGKTSESKEKTKKSRRDKPVIPFGVDKTQQGIEGVAAFAPEVSGKPSMPNNVDSQLQARQRLIEQDRKRMDARAAKQDRLARRSQERVSQNLRRQADEIRRQMQENAR